MDKKQFRAYAKNIRQNVINTDNKTKCILKNLTLLAEFSDAKTVFSYMNIQSEVPTFAINEYILQQKKTLALPKVYEKSMKFHLVKNLKNDTQKGAFNVLEPSSNLPILEKFDVILVPAVAYSQDGFRLGYGAGFYDKYLSNKKGVFVGVCFDEQIFPQIPKETFDIKMDFIVTPTKIVTI